MKNNSWLLVGLGNVGNEFKKTRHNVGFVFLDTLFPNAIWKKHPTYLFTEETIGSTKIIALKPQTMMNLSGRAVQEALATFQIPSDRLIVIADNVDLPFGTVKFNNRLSAGSHNGLKNIANHSPRGASIHIGVGRQNPLQKWVLSSFPVSEWKQLPTLFHAIKNHLKKVWNQPQKTLFATKLTPLKAASKAKQARKLVVAGAFFGDEGKGKVVDYYAEKFDIIARYAGGDNAGHTIKVQDQVYEFSILPVAMIRADKISFLGAGCLINLTQLCSELDNLIALKIHPGKLRIAARAHVILPYHLMLDQIQETQKAAQKIGTTKRGIGPCVSDKVNRIGIQIADFFAPKTLKTKLAHNLSLKNPLFPQPFQLEKLFTDLMCLFERIKPFVVDSAKFWVNNEEKSVLFEGAQGTLLDLNYGIYPFVTSTSPITWQASLGTLCNLQKAQLLGVFKAYVSRVGTGPLPTEIKSASLNELIAEKGHEYGTVTNRRRQIGWFDAVLARYAIRVNGFQQIALTLLDVLSVCEEIKICTHYLIDGKKYYLPPFIPSDWTKIEPQYISLSGWNQTDFSTVKKYLDLPVNARKYIEKLEQLLKLPVTFISIGKERTAAIKR